jgi:hypothetical protein
LKACSVADTIATKPEPPAVPWHEGAATQPLKGGSRKDSAFNHPVDERLTADDEEIPLPFGRGNKLFWSEWQIECYLARCLSLSEPEAPAETKLITAAQVLERLGVCKRSLQRMVRKSLEAKARREAAELAAPP